MILKYLYKLSNNNFKGHDFVFYRNFETHNSDICRYREYVCKKCNYYAYAVIYKNKNISITHGLRVSERSRKIGCEQFDGNFLIDTYGLSCGKIIMEKACL